MQNSGVIALMQITLKEGCYGRHMASIMNIEEQLWNDSTHYAW